MAVPNSQGQNLHEPEILTFVNKLNFVCMFIDMYN